MKDPIVPKRETAEELLNEMLAAHEGGGPSVTIGYDDATRNYFAEQAYRFGKDQPRDSGYGGSVGTALADLKLTQEKRRAKERVDYEQRLKEGK